MLLAHARSLLFLPASNARAIEKARALPCDMVLLDLEDAVADADKPRAREALKPALAQGFGDRLVGVRLNATDSPCHADDLAAMRGLTPDFIVLPKVERAVQPTGVFAATRTPVIAMIESAAGVAHVQEIAATKGVAGLFMGTNDLRRDLRIPMSVGRQGLAYVLQKVVLAARLAGVAVFDGVYNRLDDAQGFAAECAEGKAFGFDGKTLIHPNQIAAANAAFGPASEELDAAHRLIAAATGGAERHDGAMIEAMHVDQAKALIARATALGETA